MSGAEKQQPNSFTYYNNLISDSDEIFISECLINAEKLFFVLKRAEAATEEENFYLKDGVIFVFADKQI